MQKIRQKYIQTTYDYREDLHLMGLNCQQINLFFFKNMIYLITIKQLKERTKRTEMNKL